MKDCIDIKEREGKFICTDILPESFTIQYLAKNPKTEDLFLLFSGGSGSYMLFKGRTREVMKRCEIIDIQRFLDCYAIKFETDNRWNIITNPHKIDQMPSHDDLEGNLIELELLECQFA